MVKIHRGDNSTIVMILHSSLDIYCSHIQHEQNISRAQILLNFNAIFLVVIHFNFYMKIISYKFHNYSDFQFNTIHALQIAKELNSEKIWKLIFNEMKSWWFMHFLLVTGVSPQYGKNCSFRSIIISSKSIFWENMPRHFYAEFYKLLGCHVALFMIIGI